MAMLSLSNSLSLLRAPLAFLFLIENTTLRIVAIVLAMLTDSIDGYLARRRQAVTRFGAILDPAMDKFFVLFTLSVLFSEGRLEVWQGCAMISRDFFLCVFGLYLSISGYWESYKFTAIRWGKVTTALQFLVLIGLTLGITFPGYFYWIFILFGMLAFVELWQIRKATAHPAVAKAEE
jgi:CDP-diacylglycerol---glycerol-3-phosphate 3-phosphatidyltransferase